MKDWSRVSDYAVKGLPLVESSRSALSLRSHEAGNLPLHWGQSCEDPFVMCVVVRALPHGSQSELLGTHGHLRKAVRFINTLLLRGWESASSLGAAL